MLHSIAQTALTFADNVEAQSAVDEAILIDREFGFPRALAYASAVKACILTVQGRLIEACACIRTALDEPDMVVTRIELAAGASPAPIALGDENSRSAASRAICLGACVKLDICCHRSRACKRHGCLRLGRKDEALDLLNEAIDGAQHPFALIHLWPFAARHVDETRLARLRGLCALQAANPDNGVARACGAFFDAVTAQRAGDPRGVELAALASKRYRELGWPLHEAYALELAGRTDAAAGLYRSCGCIEDARRLEKRQGVSVASTNGSSRLSPRQREVASMIGQGLTNRAIAQALCVREKTVENYAGAIYAKLGLSSRGELAAHIAGAGLSSHGVRSTAPGGAKDRG